MKTLAWLPVFLLLSTTAWADTPPPAAVLFLREVRYDAKLSDAEARFTVSLDAEASGKGEATMKLFEGDVALLPVSGTYVMTADEAAVAAKAIKPRVAVPMHYGDADVVGVRADAEHFKKLCEHMGIETHILPKT